MSSAHPLASLDLQLYSAAWCSDCRRLDRWLESQNLVIPKVDIEADPAAAARLERETGKRAIPFFLVNGRTWVRGYHKELPSRFSEALLVEELRAAAHPS